MRTTVTIDDDVYEAAQAHARATGQRLGQVISAMARHALKPGPRRSRRSRFASFDVPTGARPISAARVQKEIDDDGVV
jgi:hypothetical protein